MRRQQCIVLVNHPDWKWCTQSHMFLDLSVGVGALVFGNGHARGTQDQQHIVDKVHSWHIISFICILHVRILHWCTFDTRYFQISSLCALSLRHSTSPFRHEQVQFCVLAYIRMNNCGHNVIKGRSFGMFWCQIGEILTKYHFYLFIRSHRYANSNWRLYLNMFTSGIIATTREHI